MPMPRMGISPCRPLQRDGHKNDMTNILSIGIIGRHNQPLLIRNYSARQGPDADLKWHYAAHCSLDFFEEREAIGFKGQDGYLGLLVAMEDYAIYGFQTNTRVKFVISFALAETTIRDIDVKILFSAIYNAYIAYISNPFSSAVSDNSTDIAPPIISQKTIRQIDAIAKPP